MDINNMKNMVVLKNLPSNMIEEAFIVLKNNVKTNKIQKGDKKNIKNDGNFAKDCIVKEAQLIIQEYINKVEKQSFDDMKSNIKIKEKYKRLKIFTIVLSIISFFCIIGILK